MAAQPSPELVAAVELSVLELVGRDQNYGVAVSPSDVVRCARGFKHTEFADTVDAIQSAAAPVHSRVMRALGRIASPKIKEAVVASRIPPQKAHKGAKACRFGRRVLKTSRSKVWKRAWHALNPGYIVLHSKFYPALDNHAGAMKLDSVYATTQNVFTPDQLMSAARRLEKNLGVIENLARADKIQRDT